MRLMYCDGACVLCLLTVATSLPAKYQTVSAQRLNEGTKAARYSKKWGQRFVCAVASLLHAADYCDNNNVVVKPANWLTRHAMLKRPDFTVGSLVAFSLSRLTIYTLPNIWTCTD